MCCRQSETPLFGGKAMKSLLSTVGLAKVASRRPWVVISAWIVVLALGAFGTSFLNSTTDATFNNEPESVKAQNLLDEKLGRGETHSETIIIRSSQFTVDDPEFQQIVERTTTDVLALDGLVTGAMNYYQALSFDSPVAESLVSADRDTMLISVTFIDDFEEALKHADEYLQRVKGERAPGFEVYTVGDISANEEFNTIAEEDLIKAEMVSLPFTLLILIVVFGALVAAGIPLILALFSIAIATGIAALISQAFELSFFVTNMISMIGLAVGIDYALFIIARFREEREHGADKRQAIEIASGTASKAVVFSGLAVVFALLGMFLIPTTIFRSLALGAILAVLVAVSAVLTLVPALLSLLGDRLNTRMWRNLLDIFGWIKARVTNTARPLGMLGGSAVALLMLPLLLFFVPFALVEVALLDGLLRPITHRAQRRAAAGAASGRFSDDYVHSGFWGAVTRLVMRRPIVSVALALTLLVGLAIPYFDMKTGFAGVETLPESDVKTAFLILEQDFYVGQLAPVRIVVDGNASDPGVQAGVTKLLAELQADGHYGQATTEVNPAGDLTLIEAPMTTDANAPASYAAIQRLRNNLIPTAFDNTPAENAVYVTGVTAFNQDFNEMIETYTPIVFAFVLGLSFILLMLAFRSIVVPLKAILMNLLSVGAAYGTMVLVFQKGFLNGIFGFQQTPTIDAWIPIFLFCVLFGLSMDYHVFLLSRIREHFDQTQNNRESVAVGLQSTARIITGAAAIMVMVFAAFASGRLVTIQQMGFGLAIAVLLDATIIRSILVPASMALLGNINWYLPRWLHWLPDLRVEGNAVPHAQPLVVEPALEPAPLAD
ncbi:MAG: hypothetical protein DCC58_02740 [Chloroflexi bacterium]|nr:MAG: hypothetical protein DCC58_02740 [Chloroflexota bacterium]